MVILLLSKVDYRMCAINLMTLADSKFIKVCAQATHRVCTMCVFNLPKNTRLKNVLGICVQADAIGLSWHIAGSSSIKSAKRVNKLWRSIGGSLVIHFLRNPLDSRAPLSTIVNRS